jgi:hypothetical protein
MTFANEVPPSPQAVPLIGQRSIFKFIFQELAEGLIALLHMQ